MRLNLRVKQTCEHAGGTVATLDEYSCECFRRGGKVRGRDSIHSGEKGEFFFLDKAALVVTTVAVMELC